MDESSFGDFPELNQVRENVQKGFIGVSGCGHGSALIHLFSARIGSENESLVHLLVDKQADVNARNSDGETPLMIAAENNNLAMTRYLLDNGAEINLQDQWKETALHRAVGKNRRTLQLGRELEDRGELVNLLLAMGAEWDITKPIFGLMPIDFAVATDNLEGSRILLEKGADVNAKSKNAGGSTALHTAVHRGLKYHVEFLLTNGANIKLKDDRGHTAMYYAKRNGASSIIKLLEQANEGSPRWYQRQRSLSVKVMANVKSPITST